MEKNPKKNVFEKPVLIVDKDGTLGIPFATHIAKERVTVLVSKHLPSKADQLIVVPYTKQVPKIPNSVYSQFYLIFNGEKRLLDLLPVFIKKAKADNTRIYFIIRHRDASESFIKKVQQMSSQIIVVLVGDIFGEVWTEENPLTQLLWQEESGEVLLLDNGLLHLYPVHIDDVIAVLSALARHKTVPDIPILYLLSPHPVTALMISRLLKKRNPELRINFITGNTIKTGYVPRVYASVFGKGYRYDEKLPVKPISPQKRTEVATRKKRRGTPSFGVMSVATVLLFLLLPILVPLGASVIGGMFLFRTYTLFEAGDVKKARTAAQAAIHFFDAAQGTKQGFEIGLQRVGLETVVEKFDTSLRTGEQVAYAALGGINGIEHLGNVFSGKALDPKNDFVKGLNELKSAYIDVSQLNAEGKIPAKYKAKITALEKIGSLGVSLTDVLPALVGLDGKKVYLVLLQNNMELRPGGGFIGSYGLLTMQNGKVAEFSVYDVYDADGQLKEHVEPPFQLKRYLGATHWFMRDSNFDVDFSKSAAAAAYFYNLETGKHIDGVMAVDTFFVRRLLQVVGPMKIPGYAETVTAENFFLLTETHAQDKFFPGSTQKKDFLSAVYTTLETKVMSQHDYGALGTAIAESIQEKHLLFAFPDKTLQDLFVVQGLSSSLTDRREEKAGIFNDYFAINEANIGANKSNYYLERTIAHTVQLDEKDAASESAIITYHNKSTQGKAFGGDYKAYVRFVLPKGTEVLSLKIDNTQQDTIPAITDPAVFNRKSFVPPKELEVELSEEEGKTIVGFLFIVPAGARKTIELSYAVPTTFSQATGAYGYNLQVVKQPGTGADPYTFSLHVPATMRILQNGSNLQQTGDGVHGIFNVAKDKSITANLTKK
jgi:hypothetical protein